MCFTVNKISLRCFLIIYRYIGTTQKLALLLDYDGTLAPLAPHPDLAILPIETKNVLERLANMPEVYISIISGRNVNNVKKMVGFESFCFDSFRIIKYDQILRFNIWPSELFWKYIQ